LEQHQQPATTMGPSAAARRAGCVRGLLLAVAVVLATSTAAGAAAAAAAAQPGPRRSPGDDDCSSSTNGGGYSRVELVDIAVGRQRRLSAVDIWLNVPVSPVVEIKETGASLRRRSL